MPVEDAVPSGAAYPPISDFALIGDCHAAALVSRWASIDWCCLPRIDSPSCFGRILDWHRGGFCAVSPRVTGFQSSRRYLDDSLVLETRLRGPEGEARVVDAFTMHTGGRLEPYRQLVRIIEGVAGRTRLRAELLPRFDYGLVRPWIRRHGETTFTAIGGDTGLLVSGDLPFALGDDHDLAADLDLAKGDRYRLSIEFRRPHEIHPDPPEPASVEAIEERLQETLDWWRRWADQAQLAEIDGAGDLLRSAIVLKALTYAPTGAIAAAATTSLPEVVGGSRNWDYRLTWVRDSSYALRSLGELGFAGEAHGFRNFIERTAAGNIDEVQVVYGITGRHRVPEMELDWLEGYHASRPVRSGNAAQGQVQLDILGELVAIAWQSHRHGSSPDDDFWRFLVQVVERAAEVWQKPDRGLWEMRGEPRHFVHSKVMCWAALDWGARMADDTGREAPVERWRSVRDEIREAVESRGYDRERGIFRQSFDRPELDAALLHLPRVGFVAYDDERMLRTVDALRESLSDHGLLRRYEGDDGLPEREGAFIACSFWLAECLSRQGRPDAASEVYGAACATANDVGLFSEEFSPRDGRMLGNFPQGLSHYAHILAALAIGGG